MKKNGNIKMMGIITFCMSFLVIFMLAKFGNADQIFKDIICEYTSIDQSNKGIERTILFGIIFLGILAYFIFYLLQAHKQEKTVNQIDTHDNDNNDNKVIALSMIAILSTYYIIYQGIYIIAIGAMIVLIIYALFDKELITHGFIAFFSSTYSIFALYRCTVFLGNDKDGKIALIAVLAMFVSLLPMLFKQKKKMINRMVLLSNILIPLSMLLYLQNRYRMPDGSIIIINVSGAIETIIILFMLAFLIEGVFRICKHWNKNDGDIGKAISVGTCTVIMAVNCFVGTGAVISTDIHHPYENIIGFSQIFELGQMPFKSYIPVSGMYSVVHGAFLYLFGDDKFSNYNVVTNLFCFVIAFIIILLLKMNIESNIVFLVAVTFFILDYNRLAFVLPIMLLLSSPKVILKKTLWINLWFMTSLLHGLYYPLYGAAVCIAFLPLGIWQIVTYIKKKEYLKDIRNIRFWFGCIINMILFILSIDMLLGTLNHILAMSEQSVLADGISRFGQVIPAYFFPYLENYEGARYILYYIFTWIPPAFFVWVSFACFLKGGKVKVLNKRFIIEDLKTGCIFLSIVIMPVICYTFTFTRLDIGNLYARSMGVLLAGCVLLLVYSFMYLKNEKTFLILVFIAFSIPIVGNVSGLRALEGKCSASYSVPEGYVFVENDSVEKIGVAFVEEEMYNKIKEIELEFQSKGKDQNYLGKPGWFGYYYYENVKGTGTLEIQTIKGLSAAEEAIDYVIANNTVVGADIDTLANYYFYNWLITSGYYYWNEKTREFIPCNRYDYIVNSDDANKDVSIPIEGRDIGRQASSFGESFDSLKERFEVTDIGCIVETKELEAEIVFEKEIDGAEADWLLIEFDNVDNVFKYVCFDHFGHYIQDDDVSWLETKMLKKDYNVGMSVVFGWNDDNNEAHSMICNMSKGKLLVPLGAGPKWLLNRHDSVSISVYENGEQIPVPNISSISVLKLQGAGK